MRSRSGMVAMTVGAEVAWRGCCTRLRQGYVGQATLSGMPVRRSFSEGGCWVMNPSPSVPASVCST